MGKKLLKEVMSDYFSQSSHSVPSFDTLVGLPSRHQQPIKPKSFSWEKVTDPSRLMRTYKFESYKEMTIFVQDMLSFQEDFDHHGKISINYPEVIIEVYTHDVNDVTELDTEYAHAADQIRHDASYYSAGEDYEY